MKTLQKRIVSGIAGAIMLLISAVSYSQSKPAILIDGSPALVSEVTKFPYWLKSGQTLAVGNKVNSISVLQYIIAADPNGGNQLQFESVEKITTQQTVPSSRAWKIESVAMDTTANIISGGGGGSDNLGNHTATQALNMSNKKINSVANAVDSGDAVNAVSIQKQKLIYAAGTFNAGTNTYSVSLSPAPVAYTPGMIVCFQADAANPDTVNLNVNGLGIKTIKKFVHTNLAPNDILAQQVVTAIYDGVNNVFQIISPTPAVFNSSCSSAPAAAGAINGSGNVCSNNTGVYFVGAISGAASYTWSYSGTGATISGNTNQVTIFFAAAATSGNLTVKGTNACGDGVVSANFPVIVNTAPLSGFSSVPTSPFDMNQNVTFTPTATGATYFWTFPSGTPATSTASNPVVYWAPTVSPGSYNVSLSATLPNGCTVTTVNAITISCHGSQTFTATGSLQTFTTPSCASSITINAYGAQGGNALPDGNGGKGAQIQGTLSIAGGTSLSILVGKQGTNSPSGQVGAGGGGGSFVWLTGAGTLQIAAGGGGGAGFQGSGGGGSGNGYNNGGYGSATTTPTVCPPSGSGGAGGSAGSGGAGGPGNSPTFNMPGAGGGAGWVSDGSNGGSGGCGVGGVGGKSPSAGGAGGAAGACNGTAGGYGGGGGGAGIGGGGGGGYNGAGGGRGLAQPTGIVSSGGGGGSYPNGTSQNNNANVQSGDGQVIITW